MECMQYTVRGVPRYLDQEIRGFAACQAKSLNQILIEVLCAGLGVFKKVPKNPELMELVGSWVENEETEKAFASMRTIDEDLWK